MRYIQKNNSLFSFLRLKCCLIELYFPKMNPIVSEREKKESSKILRRTKRSRNGINQPY
jgi:hypothetical protein